jgi:hypothetical protein
LAIGEGNDQRKKKRAATPSSAQSGQNKKKDEKNTRWAHLGLIDYSYQAK